MNSRKIEILKGISSAKRCLIMELISEGVTHPDDIAGKLNDTRQAVDKQLDMLYKLDLIDKKAITPPNGRPRVVFELTGHGKTLFADLEKILQKYLIDIEENFKQSMEILDVQLLQGEINEEVYHKRCDEIKKKFKITQLRK